MPNVSEALTSSVNQGEHEHDGPVHPSLLAPTNPPKVPHRLPHLREQTDRGSAPAVVADPIWACPHGVRRNARRATELIGDPAMSGG